MAPRLADQPSAYLRQHAHQPVDWFPWGPEAFAEAHRRQVPVIVSIGYSSCHWCHVMAHESFDDPAIAAVMNDRFVAIKVDREERPDVDALYMDVVQAITGRGGWPLTVFTTSDGSPFFGGTYYRPDQFRQLLDVVTDVWTNRRDDVATNVEALTEALGRTARLDPPSEVPDRTLLDAARDRQRATFDPVWGGFGPAPKFPSVSNLLLVARFAAEGDDQARHQLTVTLDAMASGGMYDHLGGGFARYSTDERWLVPHFEKMLYDQALALRAYTAGWLLTGRDLYAQVVAETVEYLERDLALAGGGFAAAEDADAPAPDPEARDETPGAGSEAAGTSHRRGVEGIFHTWTPDEIRQVLGDGDRADRAIAWWGITPEGDFEGRSIPNRLRSRGELARDADLDTARQRLLAARERRPRPLRDDKVVLDWNALLVGALAEAAMAWGRADWADLAETTADWLITHLRDETGRWRRTWHGATTPAARHDALAGDHAALVDAFVRLHEATGHARWITEARGVADRLIDAFWDRERGGVFTTARDGDHLVVRQKDLVDNATPSANGLAAIALTRLAAITGDETYRRCAEVCAGLCARVGTDTPLAVTSGLEALGLLHDGPLEAVIPGSGSAARALVEALHRRWHGDLVISWGEPLDSPLWEGRSEGQGYVCRRFSCERPATDVAGLLDTLTRARS